VAATVGVGNEPVAVGIMAEFCELVPQTFQPAIHIAGTGVTLPYSLPVFTHYETISAAPVTTARTPAAR
jgi:hypothetical protein